ncbi:MAG TPA: Holliday junction resolvase RuvX [Kofleriaceae bacterium]|nr:Holliday junction resolvase RuvX [Kofleriaceae bacterium]
MRALGLDVGSKTIGVAISDELSIAAHPLTVLERAGNVRDAQRIRELVTEHAAGDVVIGIPYELSGRIGHRARRVRELVSALREVLGDAVTLHEQDERFTTAEAQRVLIDADVSRAKRKQVIDQQAAALILQGWLDARRPSR